MTIAALICIVVAIPITIHTKRMHHQGLDWQFAEALTGVLLLLAAAFLLLFDGGV